MKIAILSIFLVAKGKLKLHSVSFVSHIRGL